MSRSSKNNYKPSFPIPFQPHEYPAPVYFTGCYCSGTCKCKFQDHAFVTPDGEFKPFVEEITVAPPRVCVWEYLSRDDHKKLELANYDKDTVFSLLEKRFPLLSKKGRGLTLELLFEALRYSRVNGMSVKKSSAILSVYYNTHQYFLSSNWRTPEETYNFFKESILLHTVQRPPKSTEILQPDESRNVLRHFVNTYLRNLALIATACLPVYRLQMIWPSRPLSAAESQLGEFVEDDAEGRTSRSGTRKKTIKS